MLHVWKPYLNKSFSSNIIIAILVGIILISLYFGVNIFSLVGASIDKLVEYTDPLFSYMAYSTDNDSNSTATANQDREVSSKNANIEINTDIDNTPKTDPSDDKSETPIQKPITSDKSSWCLIGEYEGKRGCISVKDSSKCMSGQVFPNEKMCLNPTKTA